MATRMYGLFWKWHFVAGLIACPLIAIVALTGALYAFQPELERWGNAELYDVAPAGPHRSADDIVAAATSADCDPSGLQIFGAADRSYLVYCRDGEREVFVDPYRARVLGTRDPSSRSAMSALLHAAFDLHWELMLGETGRLLVEWATSCTVMLMISGAILWWPRGKRRSGGVLYPRLRLSGRQWLRDLHAVFGMYMLPVLFVLAATGLMWTRCAGDDRWARLGAEHHAPVTSRVIEGAPRIGVDAALAAANIDPVTDGRNIYIGIPGTPEEPYGLYLHEVDQATPWVIESTSIDAYSGSLLERAGWDTKGAHAKLDQMRYAIHVGAILGLPGRILACVASLMLAALCITGPWMWWKRRPTGRVGVPPAARTPWPLYLMLAAFGWLLPTIGYTLLAIAAFEVGRLATTRWLRRFSGGAPVAGSRRSTR